VLLLKYRFGLGGFHNNSWEIPWLSGLGNFLGRLEDKAGVGETRREYIPVGSSAASVRPDGLSHPCLILSNLCVLPAA